MNNARSRVRELLARFRTLLRLVIGAAAIGLLAVFHVPVQLFLLVSAGIILLMLLNKFIKDNIRLAREVGWKRLLGAMLKSAIVFIPVLVILYPGYWVGNQINQLTNRAIEHIQIWSAPEIISKEIQTRIEHEVEIRVKRNLPWWYGPAIKFGWVDDYVTQTKTEFDIAIETINEAKPKPAHIRAGAGLMKAALLAIGTYSTAWVMVLFTRAYASLFGRVLVASKPPVVIGSGNPGSHKRGCKSREYSGSPIDWGSQVSIPLASGERIYVRRTDLPGNAPPDWHLRWRSGCLMMRMRKRLFSMDLVVGTDEARNYPFRASAGSQYLSIILAESQEVVVNPDCLVGFSNSIRFRSHWDFNLAILALHHAVSMVACGPGRLILKCPGAPTVHQDASKAVSGSMYNLMLFGQDSRFEIEASKGIQNYFASGCLVRPISGKLFVTSPGVPLKANMVNAMWGLIKQVYMPI